MALLDVTEVLLDPDFMDSTLACERTAQTVGNDGVAVNTVTLMPFSGVVTSNQGDILERIAAGERINGNITIHTMFVLQDGSAGFTADVVQWRGNRYTVSNVNDYEHFGQGFVSASCDIIPLAG
ncbi:MAG TPA: hypothetical protein VN046_05260 [Stenotrophobium sp.]|nr:hypothetical protein [Stenotrophobium sp.]